MFHDIFLQFETERNHFFQDSGTFHLSQKFADHRPGLQKCKILLQTFMGLFHGEREGSYSKEQGPRGT